MPKTEIPNDIGWFAVIQDPEGVPLSIFESKEPMK